MKKSLSYSLWDEPGVPILTYAYKMRPLCFGARG